MVGRAMLGSSCLLNPFLSESLIPINLHPSPSLSSSSSSNAVLSGHEDRGILPPRPSKPPHLCFSKPSWVVQTQSNVRKWVKKKPDPPCVVCNGSGKVECKHCVGKGRTNYAHLTMLPKGKWPKWCRTCGGSGHCYCDRCLGTGEYRDVLGFHFLKDADTSRNSSHKTSMSRANEHLGAADILLSQPDNLQDGQGL